MNEVVNRAMPRLVDEREAAKMLAITVSALRRWRREGSGPVFTHCGRCVRYSLHALADFVEQNSSRKRRTDDHTPVAVGGAR